MAESKSSLLAKSVQKHAGRAKEKLLQNLGKVDRTADEIFDEHLTNFNRQQTNANRLQKEFNNYIRCIRAVQASSKLLMDAISDVYETPWSGAEALHAQVSSIEVLWQEFSHKLGDQVLIPLNTYTAQFPEMKKKIEKRNRKLIDYDSQRHSFQSLQANSNKRRDDGKVTKGRDQLDEARRTYEILNTELHDELPALHDSRILFLVTNLQTLFASEQVFHNETSKIYAEMEAIVDKLATDSQRGSYTIKKINGTLNSMSPPHSPSKLGSISPVNINSFQDNGILSNGTGNNANNSPSTPPSSLSSSAKDPSITSTPTAASSSIDTTPTTPPTATAAVTVPKSPTHSISDHEDDNHPQYENAGPEYQNAIVSKGAIVSSSSVPETNRSSTVVEHEQNSLNANGTSGTVSQRSSSTSSTIVASENNNSRSGNVAETVNGNGTLAANKVVTAASDSTTAELPPGALYRVKATYKYLKEDVDELSFEVGDTICVIEYDDPEDQEEGWLMGMKEGTTEKGMFPANFTRPL